MMSRTSTMCPAPTRRRFRRGSLAATALALLVVLAAPLVLVACGDERPAAPAGAPSITGTVKTATAGDDGATVAAFLVTQGAGDYDKAQLGVTAGTAWYRMNADKVEAIEAPAADALVGKRVEVQFTGPVRESYPVQATAGWVIVHE
jgi:hypothetical protein